MMKPSNYYDHRHNKTIDLATDGCALADWQQQFGHALFARHPKGFLVFVPPAELPDSDEYRDGDPYQTEVNLGSGFQRRRCECTLELLQEAIQGLGRTPRILDLGCGQGHLTWRMLKDHPEAEIYGLDYAVSAIEYATERFSGIEFVVASAYESPFPDGYFDVVVCNNLWEHVRDPLMLSDRIRKLLRPGGYLIISTPSRYCLGNLLRVLQGKRIELASRYHVTEYTVGQVMEQLRYGGFKVLRAYSKPIRHGGLKARIAQMIASTLISLTGSHHVLETTVFYLAQREQP